MPMVEVDSYDEAVSSDCDGGGEDLSIQHLKVRYR